MPIRSGYDSSLPCELLQCELNTDQFGTALDFHHEYICHAVWCLTGLEEESEDVSAI